MVNNSFSQNDESPKWRLIHNPKSCMVWNLDFVISRFHLKILSSLKISLGMATCTWELNQVLQTQLWQMISSSSAVRFTLIFYALETFRLLISRYTLKIKRVSSFPHRARIRPPNLGIKRLIIGLMGICGCRRKGLDKGNALWTILIIYQSSLDRLSIGWLFEHLLAIVIQYIGS